MQSPATFMISVITFKSPVFKENIKQFHITLGVQFLASALSFFHLSNKVKEQLDARKKT